MPVPVMAAVAAGTSLLGSASSMFGASSAAKSKEEAAEKQAKFTYAQRMEEIRRRQLQDAQVEGTAVAASYASNLQGDTGSPKQYLNALRAEHGRQVAWAKEAARKEKRMIEKGGDSPGLSASLLGQAASGISGAIGAYRGAT